MDASTFHDKLSRCETEDEAIDLTYEVVDDLLLAGDFAAVDALFMGIDVARLRPSVLESLRIVTNRASPLLPNRHRLFPG